MAKKKIINEGGINGSGKGLVNTNSEDFLFLKEQIINASDQQSKKQIAINNLLSLKYQMEDYFRSQHPSETISVGSFLRKFIDILGLKQKLFAEYIGIEDSNLSALLKSKRKLNLDLSIKLSKIFNIPPTLWLSIQNKNELLKFKKKSDAQYEKYNLDDLLKQVG